MPRFFFDIHDGRSPWPDLFGDDIETVEEARDQARAILADFAVAKLPAPEGRSFTCEVRDGHVVVYRCSLTLSCEVLRRPR